MLIDVQRIEMISCFLDAYADSLWPGWKGYRDAKFRFVYPNKLEMLVGYDAVPAGYLDVRDVRLPGKMICVKTEGEISFPVHQPFTGGGITINPGLHESVVLIQYPPKTLSYHWAVEWHRQKRMSADESFRLLHTSDGQILTYIHELFHVFENTFADRAPSYSVGNPDDVYAAHTEVEGIALERAFLEKNDVKARMFIEDFLAARDAKHRHMSDSARLAEAHGEWREGLCTYVEFEILKYLRTNTACRPRHIDDQWYFGFRDAAYFLEFELEILRRCRGTTMDLGTKRYVYGYYQALLLDRFMPGWKRDFLRQQRPLSDLLREAIRYDSTIARERERRLQSLYELPALRKKHAQFIAEGAKVVHEIEARKGKKYILDVSRIGHLDFVARGNSYSYDDRTRVYYPEGFERVEIHNLSLESAPVPFLVATKNLVEWIDDDRGVKMSLSTGGVDEQGLHRDAVVKTGGFTLKAARLRISETERFIKLSVFPVRK
jgi:hypothetical protein